MKLQNLTVIFIIIVLPIILLVSLYISTGLKTIKYQALYDDGVITATQDAIQAYEINSLKNKYSDNAEIKRSIIKSSVKMLEQSLCNTCNISSYNTNEIEEYIPAVLFGMRNGFYLYAPSYNPDPEHDKYEHSLKNYVYYSEQLTLDNTEGVVIIYHLDSYIEVSGWFNGNYESQEGYLINYNEVKFSTDSISDVDKFYNKYRSDLDGGSKPGPSGFNVAYYDINIDTADELAVNYFVDNYKFSKWFKDNVVSNIKIGDVKYNYLIVDQKNDPEDPESDFSMHKKEVIRKKIQNVLNSSITAYSERTYGKNYKMPKLTEEDWEKIYTDVSLTTFFQGKKIGFTEYNGYCVLNSNNNYELINPNLLYFSTDNDGNQMINTTKDYYHDIRCNILSSTTSISVLQDNKANIQSFRGYKIGRFNKKDNSDSDSPYDSPSEERDYSWERKECACYDCINGSNIESSSVYNYIKVAGDKRRSR